MVPTNQQAHALALLENGWTVRAVNGQIEWRSPRGISGSEYNSISLDEPPNGAIEDALIHGDYYATAAKAAD
jgi:hypothetical protein